MLVTHEYHGVPSPSCGPPLNIQIGDIVELLCADIHSSWWQVRTTDTLYHLTRCKYHSRIIPCIFLFFFIWGVGLCPHAL